MTDGRCYKCRYFMSDSELEEDEGWCYRYPPQDVYEWGEGVVYSVRPMVDWLDFCGEFELDISERDNDGAEH